MKIVFLVMLFVPMLISTARARMAPSTDNWKVPSLAAFRVLKTKQNPATESFRGGGGSSTTDQVFTLTAGPSRKGSGH